MSIKESDFIPPDLVGLQMQGEGAAVAPVNHRILGNIGVVDHTILAVLYIGMDLCVVILAEPGVQPILIMGRPQDGPVEQPGNSGSCRAGRRYTRRGPFRSP